ncbi:Sugar phosphate permease [Friedmanniella luteola]|uniref:Sugar phosphate permease n=1 Tax=Friedmanniella luteola TaxID=546871 RepID=A0A1H2A609_9ACTN|nr:MFS transporter [Friedmanniella luteola]SDT41405.1 Sugar phosphate permease [Friedmanniella luteola]
MTSIPTSADPTSTDPGPGPAAGGRRPRLHPAWWVAVVAFVALLGAAGFRSAPGVLMVPLEEEFGWSRSLMSFAVSVNLVLYGLMAPFAAALMDRFGLRRVTSAALLLVAAGSGLTVFLREGWQLVLTWGLLIGVGTGSMAMVFAATIANRWFVARRGLVMGILTAAGATGQLVFLPVMAGLVERSSWRAASLVVTVASLAVVPLVLLVLRDHPADRGVRAYGAPADVPEPPRPDPAGAVRRTLAALRRASRVPTFWALAGGFAICGATTNGLIGTHFVPSAHDHGMAETTAAGLLALVGIFDIVGTIVSGALTDRIDPRLLLVAYYAFRGLGLAVLPWLLSAQIHPSMLVFIVIYGLDWVATVPPTAALCRRAFGADGTIVFGWVFASHQVGAAIAASVAGVVRDVTGQYTLAWFGAAGLCVVAAAVSFGIRRGAPPVPA